MKQRVQKGVSVMMSFLLAFLLFPSVSLLGVVASDTIPAYADGETEEEKAYPDIQELIVDNLDASKVTTPGSSNPFGWLASLFFGADEADLNTVGFLPVVFSIADTPKMNGNETIDGIWKNAPEAMAATYRENVNVYDVDSNSDYLVAFANYPGLTGMGQFKEAVFYTDDAANPISLNEAVSYDPATGLIYIPKKFDTTEALSQLNGEHVGIQAQLLYAMDIAGDNATKKLDVSIDNKMAGVTAPFKTKSLDVYSLDTSVRIPIATPETAPNVDKDAIQILANNGDVNFAEGMENEGERILAAYDNTTGELVLNVAPVSLSSVQIVLGETGGVFEAEKAYAAQKVTDYNEMTTYVSLTNGDEFSAGYCTTYQAGFGTNPDNYDSKGSLPYCYSPSLATHSDADNNRGISLLINEGNVIWDQVGDIYKTDTIEGDDWHGTQMSCDPPSSILQGSWPSGRLSMICGAVGTPSAENKNSETAPIILHILVVDEENGTLVFSVGNNNTVGQSCTGIYKASFESSGTATGVKVSKTPQDTQGNSNYSLAGAQYGIYDGGSLIATLTTDENGNTNSANLKKGNYTVKELSPSKGFTLDPQTYTLSVSAGVPATFSSVEPPQYGELKLTKTSTDKEALTNPYYTFEGIVYELVGNNYGHTYTITLDAKGNGSVGHIVYDTYTLKEVSTNKWYEKSEATETIAINESTTNGGTQAVTKTVEDTPVYVWFDLYKSSNDPSITDGNSRYTLEDAQYTITNTRNGVSDGSGFVMHTDKNGYAKSRQLLYDDYSIQETLGTKEGHAIDSSTYDWSHTKLEPGKVHTLKGSDGQDLKDDAQVDASLKIQKKDAYSDSNVPEGAATLKDAVFEIKYYDVLSSSEIPNAATTRTWYVRTDDKGYADLSFIEEGEFTVTTKQQTKNVTKTFKSDAPYVKNGQNVLPLGYVTIQEVLNPVGYKFDNGKLVGPGVLQGAAITGDRTVVDKDYDRAIYGQKDFKDIAYRSDFEMTKKDENNNVLTNMPFMLISNTTGEAHAIVTDENGKFMTATQDEVICHSNMTNENDKYVEKREDGKWYVTDASKMDCTNGIWFTGYGPNNDPDGSLASKVEVNDELGALPFDTYTLIELANDTNKGKSLIETQINISRDGKVINFNDLIDYTMRLKTIATDNVTGSHDGDGNRETVQINDEVEYSGLEIGKTYTIVGKLMDKETGVPITDANGKEYTSSVTFTTDDTVGAEVIPFVCKGSDVRGKSVVIFETLYDGTTEKVSHNDINDVKQMVDYPAIATTATDSVTGTHDGSSEGNADGYVIVRDEVAYFGLQPNVPYVIQGTLMDKATGQALVDEAGNTFTSKVEFTPENKNGSAIIEFSVPSRVIAGKTVVAFEKLFRNNVEIAIHEDITDPAQTVFYPYIGTTATDQITADHVGLLSDTVTISDAVEYKNLPFGKTYYMTGKLVDKETGTFLHDADGKEMENTKKFVAGSNEEAVAANKTVNEYLDGASELLEYFAGLTTEEHEAIGYDEEKMSTVPTYDDVVNAINGLKEFYKSDTGENMKLKDDAQTTLNALEDVYYNLSAEQQENISNFPTMKKVVEATEVLGASSDTSADADGRVSGTVILDFTVDRAQVAGKAIVVFEYLYDEASMTVSDTNDEASEYVQTDSKPSHAIATHTDITTEGQTVYYPEIGTEATVDGMHNIDVTGTDGTITLIDTVSYKGLQVGREYRVEGTLMSKSQSREAEASGESAEGVKAVDPVTGEEITSSTTFTPETSDGVVEIAFTFNPKGAGDKIPAFASLVAFEEMYLNDVEADNLLIAQHKDINDVDQTVNLSGVADDPIDLVGVLSQTGDILLYVVLPIAVLAAIGMGIYRKRRADKILTDGMDDDEE